MLQILTISLGKRIHEGRSLREISWRELVRDVRHGTAYEIKAQGRDP